MYQTKLNKMYLNLNSNERDSHRLLQFPGLWDFRIRQSSGGWSGAADTAVPTQKFI
jgi:hypothetical protein